MHFKTSRTRLPIPLAALAAGVVAVFATLTVALPTHAGAKANSPATIAAASSAPAGDYVEARTASVFAGACHYSGEYMSDGREAIMAWHFARGTWQGTPLSGLSAIAVVRSDVNLAQASGHRHTCLYVDGNASPAERAAMADALEAHDAGEFGDVTKVEPASISFARTSTDSFHVAAPGVASLDIKALPNRECCKMPSLVWYKPLAPIEDRRVGFTKLASCTDATGGDSWSRGNENSAFYGTFRW